MQVALVVHVCPGVRVQLLVPGSQTFNGNQRRFALEVVTRERRSGRIHLDALQLTGEVLDDRRNPAGIQAGSVTGERRRRVAVRDVSHSCRIGARLVRRVHQAPFRDQPVGRLLLGEPDVEVDLRPQRRIELRRDLVSGVGNAVQTEREGQRAVHVEAVRMHHRVGRIGDLNDGVPCSVRNNLRKDQDRRAPVGGHLGARPTGHQSHQRCRHEPDSPSLPTH